ncbi:hypothetical protein [Paraburkholderia bonniea]|uniref:hypothetical protein n=1 Tax=Paraburkholderia bonniea TaxID=2152891 RepID=UPI001291F2E8|nr:hypothetical protein [Paraburkholderia bonniea]
MISNRTNAARGQGDNKFGVAGQGNKNQYSLDKPKENKASHLPIAIGLGGVGLGVTTLAIAVASRVFASSNEPGQNHKNSDEFQRYRLEITAVVILLTSTIFLMHQCLLWSGGNAAGQQKDGELAQPNIDSNGENRDFGIFDGEMLDSDSEDDLLSE